METENGGQEPAGLANTPEFLALNPKQLKFVFGYLKHGNASQAARDAGYSKKTARVQASQLLTNVNIQAALAVAQKDTKASLERDYTMSRKERLDILAKIARANLRKVVDVSHAGVSFHDREDISDDDFLTIKSISYSSSSGKGGDSTSLSIATHDRVKAIELMSRMAGDIDADPDAGKGNKPVDSGIADRLRDLRSKYLGQRK